MRKVILCTVFVLLFFSCSEKKIMNHIMETESNDKYDTESIQINKNKKHYKRAELNEEFDFVGNGDIGIPFWKEFPNLKHLYNLNEMESEMIGRWIECSVDWVPPDLGSPYYFFPNKFIIINYFYPFRYGFRNNTSKYLDKGIGTWEIKNGMIVAKLYYLIIYNKDERKNEMISVKPYEIEVVNIKDIDKEGYSKKPFTRPFIPDELKDEIIISIEETHLKKYDKVGNDYIMVRYFYTLDVLPSPRRNYGYFQMAPDMAKEGVSGLDIVQNPDLIKKYILNL